MTRATQTANIILKQFPEIQEYQTCDLIREVRQFLAISGHFMELFYGTIGNLRFQKKSKKDTL